MPQICASREQRKTSQHHLYRAQGIICIIFSMPYLYIIGEQVWQHEMRLNKRINMSHVTLPELGLACIKICSK